MVSVSIAYSTGDRQPVSMGPKAMSHCEGPCFFANPASLKSKTQSNCSQGNPGSEPGSLISSSILKGSIPASPLGNDLRTGLPRVVDGTAGRVLSSSDEVKVTGINPTLNRILAIREDLSGKWARF